MPVPVKKPRPQKNDLPATKPNNQAAAITALWAAVESLAKQVDRLVSDDDTRAETAAQIRKSIKNNKKDQTQ